MGDKEEKDETYTVRAYNTTPEMKETLEAMNKDFDINIAFAESEREGGEQKVVISGPCGDIELGADQLSADGIRNGISGIACTRPTESEEAPSDLPEVPPLPEAPPGPEPVPEAPKAPEKEDE